MSGFKLLLLSAAVFFFVSCERKEMVDEFIEKYDNADFSMFKDVHITLRRGAYIFSDEINKSVYFVEFKDGQVINVGAYDSVKRHLSNDKIKTLLKAFDDYEFYSLGCDKKKNVFINPFYAGGGTFFLRVDKESGQKEIRLNNNIFIHYKGRWYISTDYLDKNNNLRMS
ncbi:hypothetical protein HYN59_05740 [Flavobacterium album]|uniref:Lipoprotein n=1 Tax=Flavobacterium album TaxID=2175091 RepID=A0A2S1QW63_9FLAO|nr:hypothetical protein [Flavobacterium album]AWH84652.1 hypothetical protein HYN59_05740 [Flavobacterium album]